MACFINFPKNTKLTIKSDTIYRSENVLSVICIFCFSLSIIISIGLRYTFTTQLIMSTLLTEYRNRKIRNISFNISYNTQHIFAQLSLNSSRFLLDDMNTNERSTNDLVVRRHVYNNTHECFSVCYLVSVRLFLNVFVLLSIVRQTHGKYDSDLLKR